MSITHFKVDGQNVSIDGDPQMPLLYALRNELGLNNPKFGCGLAQCGACTVHLNGVATRSCVLPISAVASQSVTTLKGLGTPENPHPLQAAFVEEQVTQCGYCVNAWLMTAAALLKKNPHASEAQIKAGLQDLKCRCGSHLAILRAIKRAQAALLSKGALA
jgi:nicotinate dehydrogenase subunit A